MFEYKGKKNHWLGHDGFKWEFEGKTVVIDPFKLEQNISDVDLVICTHEHFDHCDPQSLPKVVGGKTTIVASPSCKETLEQLGGKIVYLNAGDETNIEGIKIKAVPAYNINKFREPNKPFHPKEAGHIGVLV
ncbi:MAG: MBL fold metallo-hydrolase, partial [Candidatus Thorarchaeota archaeon]